MKNKIVASLLLATLGLHAQASDYYVILPNIAKAAALADATAVTLNGGTLAEANINQSYSFDLKDFLQVTGDPAYSPANVSWSLANSTLPTGLNLSGSVITGTPTVSTPASGNTFSVQANYNSKLGTQAYKIIVNRAELYVTQLAAGVSVTCGITPSGGVKCWGNNFYGQLGNGTTTDSLSPVDVVGLTSGVSKIMAGHNGNHLCAALTAGGVKCWGYNNRGQLGDGTTVNRTIPVTVQGITAVVTDLAGLEETSCAVVTGGVMCWGSNAGGYLGNGSYTSNGTPAFASGIGPNSGAARLAGGDIMMCAVFNDASAKCWGTSTNGMIGTAKPVNNSYPTPQSVVAVSNVRYMAMGRNHSCAASNLGGVQCWGSGARLGYDSYSDSWSAVNVLNITDKVKSLSAGGSHTCAVTEAGALWCWGYGSNGQIGDGSTTYAVTRPAQVMPNGSALSVSAGYYHTCAVLTDNTAKCWGHNGFGQLGTKTTVQQTLPSVVKR